MPSRNLVLLMGHLGKDPELKETNSGKKVCNFTMATTEGYGDKATTSWHSVVCWEKTAENCAKYLGKGHAVDVEGRLQYRSYEKDGVTKYVTEIVAHRVQFVSRPKGQEQQQTQQGGPINPEEIPF